MKELERVLQKLLHDHGINETISGLVLEFTQGVTSEMDAVSEEQMGALLMYTRSKYAKELNTPYNQTPANQMRRKVIALFKYKMGYSMDELNRWVEKYSAAHKKFNKHSYHELVTLVSQAERVYKSYVKSINKQSV